MMRRWCVAGWLVATLAASACSDPAPPSSGPVCGNRIKEGAEQCDEGVTETPRCGYGQTSCTVCSSSCELVAGRLTGYCGDQIAQTDQGEMCDAGRMPPTECGPDDTSCLVCDSQCDLVPGVVVGRCGDGTVQAARGEECEPGADPATSCAYGERSCQVCSSECALVDGQLTGFCGDGIVDPDNQEACDPARALSCAAEGAGAGLAACTDACAADTSACFVYKSVALTERGGCALDDKGAVRCWGGLTAPAQTYEVLTAGTRFVCGYRSAVGAMPPHVVECWGEGAPTSLIVDLGSSARGSQLAAGDDFVCALSGGNVSCSAGAPMIPTFFVDVVAISAAARHVCALNVNNVARCWGESVDVGQLNAPSTVSFSTIATSPTLSCGVIAPDGRLRCWGEAGRMPPDAIRDGENVAVYLSATHGCGQSATGQARCWGEDTLGQTRLEQLTRWGALALGAGTSCGVTEQGQLSCIGDNAQQQTIPSMEPAARVVASDDMTCALGVNGAVQCWGANAQGRSLWAASGASRLYLGDAHACMLDSTGRARCVGLDADGQSSPPANTRWRALALGARHSCGILMDNTLRCTGAALGTAPAGEFALIASGDGFACAADAEGAVQCWGDIAPPDAALRVKALVAGGRQICALDRAGAVVCWGTLQGMPPAADGFAQLDVSGAGACALDEAGAPTCWGAAPIAAAPAGETFVQVAVGASHACGVVAGGDVRCWGQSAHGAGLPPLVWQ